MNVEVTLRSWYGLFGHTHILVDLNMVLVPFITLLVIVVGSTLTLLLSTSTAADWWHLAATRVTRRSAAKS